MPTLDRWNSTWADLGIVPGPAAEFSELVARYAEPHRHYHSMEHLRECFGHLDECSIDPERRGELELALWCHDIIYDTRSPENEEQSARWAEAALERAGAPTAVSDRVSQLILVTKHDGAPSTPDERLLLDIDLAILGASNDRFDRYEVEVREEYSWVPAEAFANARAGILRQFLERPRLYETDEFFDRLETPARRNLARSLAALEA